MSKTILLIDDDPAVLEVLNQCLRPHYRTRIATRGQRGLELAQLEPQPDLILLDVELPDVKGYTVCAALKKNSLTASIPVMFLSSHTDVFDITFGLQLGAVDYVAKPVAPPILLARVQTHLRLRDASDWLRDQNLHLETLVARRTRDLEARTRELQNSQDLTIFALGSIAETRDNETGNHIFRTSAYVEVMARRLAERSSWKDALEAREWEMIWKSAPLHDIGKVGIPDQILLKPGKLTADEFEVMKRHTVLGRDAIRSAEVRVKSDGSFLRVASEIAFGHHERWDGGGYPQGIGADDIPLPARLMALADVYDALVSKRVYKSAMAHPTAVELIAAGRGTQFDPEILDVFLETRDAFEDITVRYSDDEEDRALSA